MLFATFGLSHVYSVDMSVDSTLQRPKAGFELNGYRWRVIDTYGFVLGGFFLYR
jgi:hypothetical protein